MSEKSPCRTLHEQSQMFVPRPASRNCRALRNQILHAFPRSRSENRFVFARIRLPLMLDRACVQNVCQKPPQ